MANLFRKISPEAARFQTLWRRQAVGLEFESAGGRWRFGAAAEAGSHGATAYGSLGGAEFTLWLDEPDWRIAVAAVLEVGPDAVAELPETLTRAALECFASEALAALEKSSGLPAALKRLELAPAQPLASAWPFELIRPDGLRIGGAWIMSERPPEARAALEKALLARKVSGGGLKEDLPLAGLVGLSAWTMPAGELGRLAAGDVALSPAG
ncbi:MAG: hypothetical protein LBV15_04815, partial [Planctomycetota bacterium]|nr:hypothetical protein [Planctomycetota bacterium]